jgi:hypothetical protein
MMSSPSQQSTRYRVEARARRVMLADIIETLEDGYHPQNPSPMHPADYLRNRYPHMLDADEMTGKEQR